MSIFVSDWKVIEPGDCNDLSIDLIDDGYVIASHRPGEGPRWQVFSGNDVPLDSGVANSLDDAKKAGENAAKALATQAACEAVLARTVAVERYHDLLAK